MGVSVSLLSLSAPTTTSLLIGAGFFAAGYYLAFRTNSTDSKKPKSIRGFISRARAMLSRSSIDGDQMTELNQNQKKKKNPALLKIESLAEILDDFKMVLVVRNDLKMGKGKIAAQCSHATLGLYKKLLARAPKSLSRWEMCGQVKVVLKTESEEDMLLQQERAKSLELPTHITIDAGRTQIAPNSRTVLAILGPSDMVDDVTGGLKLL